MSMERFDYCNFGSHAVINSILEKAFTIHDFEPVNNAYQNFKHCFENQGFRGQVQTIGRKNFIPKTSDNCFLERFSDSNYTIGVDLPVMISNKELYNGKCVFIVGEDALRQKQCNQDIILSTPFGTHQTSYRDFGGKLYWKFSMWLLAKGYKIYYTDIKKIWIKKMSEQKKMPIPTDLFFNFKQCLSAEIDQFKPEMVITFGKEAKSSISQIGINKTIGFIHPTFAASKHWKVKYNLSSASADNKFGIMIKEFEEIQME